jgi:hypothetical protein
MPLSFDLILELAVPAIFEYTPQKTEELKILFLHQTTTVRITNRYQPNCLMANFYLNIFKNKIVHEYNGESIDF